ncbi:MAG: amidase [Desulfobacterales bacterium]|jgi:aspartyl-tRNA(Asn)/glutamyl-tRNA(Gln) amidotransferase subunit A
MAMTPLHYQTISELAALIRKGEITCVELARHFISRINRLEDKLNAYRLLCMERAMDRAKAADSAFKEGGDRSPLQGIPYAVKDLINVKGLATTAGAKIFEQHIAAEDAAVIHRLEQAGMILLGKTNTVQFAFSGVGINHDHGTPYNPWSESHYLPGGSSSGSGVAVAAGLVPMALGTDTGGSVRVPAALCGTAGLKTTVGRVSRAGVYPLSWSLDSVGVLARSVADAALVYQCMQGADINDDTTLGLADQDVLKDLKSSVKGRRLAFAETVFFDDIHPEVNTAVRVCGDVFKELGAEVSSIKFAEAAEALALNPGGVFIASEGYTVNQKWLVENFDQLDPVVAQRMIKGKEIPAAKYLGNMLAAKRLRAKVYNILKDIDALLVPTTCVPAIPVTEVDTDIDTYLKYNAMYLRNTNIGNTLNLCGLNVPCGFTKEGLPIGLLIYGKPFQEEVVLNIGYAFQQSTDWHRKTPDLSWLEEA